MTQLAPRPWLLSLAFLIGVAFGVSSEVHAVATVRVTNIATGSALRYPVALLRGEVKAPDGFSLTVSNRTSRRPSRQFQTEVSRGHFKALMELVPGANRLTLRCGASKARFELRYVPMSTPFVLRMIYLTDDTGHTAYMTQKAGDAQDYAAKLDTLAKLMQTFTAETLHDAGFGRKTFRLELDNQGRVMVHTVKAPKPASYYQTRTGNELFSELYGWIDHQFPTDNAKNCVIMGFSGYDARHRRPLAHTALGGGGLGLFSNLDMFTWPNSLQDLPRAFYDPTRVDTARVFDDSAFRGTFWGMAGTTTGAVLHEMGHTFGLPHSPDPYSIMSRGFDHFHRAFTFYDPPSGRPNARATWFKDNEVARFEPVSAARLAYSRYFQPDAATYAETPGPTATVDATSGHIIITAPAGLRIVGLNRDGLSRDNILFPLAAPQHMEYTRDELSHRAGGDGFSLALTDAQGRSADISTKDLAEQRQEKAP